MKKIYFTLFFLPLMSASSFAQLSIIPNTGYRSQSLTASISDALWDLTSGSTPMSNNDIFLYRSGTYIYSNSWTVISPSTLHATFTIPPAAPAGLYDVYVNPYWLETLYSGFNVQGSSVSGYVYNDINSNGVQDAGESKLPYKQILVQPGNHIAYTDINGNYNVELPTGNYTVQFVPDTTWIQTSSPTTYNVNLTIGSVPGNIFGVHAPNGWYGVTTFLGCESGPRCNTERDYTIVIHNIGTSPQNGTVEFTKPALLTFVSATPTPTTVVGNLYTWDYTNLQPNDYRSFVIRLAIPYAPHVHIVSHAFTTARDLSNNIVDTAGYYLYQEIICAGDPNDKIVDPTGDTSSVPHYTDINAELFYTIHFSNVGNDTAFSVNITDTVDVSLDLNTLQYQGSSHYVQIFREPNRKVRFYFPNINLPDSTTSEVNSHGFVSYSIRPIFGLPDFTPVSNKAYIVFDQNPYVLTNTTLNTLVSFTTGGLDNSLSAPDVNFFPNPVTDESVLVINQKGKHSYELMIYDASGQLIKTVALTSNNYVLKKKDFASGLYLYRLKESNGSFMKSGKLVIE